MAKILGKQIPVYQKNLLINGDMNIAQRGTSFAAIASTTYSLDRWRYAKVGTAVHTVSQDTDVPTVAQVLAATGQAYLFQKSLRMNVTTAQASFTGSDWVGMAQRVEGYNFAPIAQKICTLSFWVKATVPGVYSVSLNNSGADRSYVAEYTVNSASSWEYKTLIIAASPSAGTWDYVNGLGLEVKWILASASGNNTSAGSWQTGNFIASTNQINSVGTISNDFRITGAMLNAGSAAAPFQMFGTDVKAEILACQRYYEKSYDLTVNPGTAQTDVPRLPYSYIANGQNIATWIAFKAIKRSAPSISTWDAAGNSSRTSTYNTANTRTDNVNSGSGSWSITSGQTVGLFGNEANLGTTIGSYGRHWAADAEL